MKSIPEFLERIEIELHKINFGSYPKELYDPIEYSLSLGGKRIRPLLLLMANDLFGGKIKEALSPALAIEVFHNFTLVHDDIMDNAPLRRNMPTVFKKWNGNIALLSGDVMLVWAYRLLAKCDKSLFPEILEIFNETAIKVCEGQQLDLNSEKGSIEGYIDMISLKTAVLIAGSLKIGALLGGASKKEANHLYAFGKNMGIAFQLQDDLLDTFGNTEKFGKKVGGDIVENKRTFLLLKADERADEKTRKYLNRLYTTRNISPEDKVAQVKKIFEALEIKKETDLMIEKYFLLAKKNLAGVKADQNKKNQLMNFMNGLMKREV